MMSFYASRLTLCAVLRASTDESEIVTPRLTNMFCRHCTSVKIHVIWLDSGWIIVRPPCYPSQLSHHECVAWLFTLVFWKHNLYFLTPSCWKGSSGISFKGEEIDLMLLFTKLRFSHVLALGFAFVVCRDSARWVVYCFCHGTNGPQFLNPRKLEQSSHQLINHLFFLLLR